jgi:transposase
VWGKQNERIEIPITNERLKQTYYGAVNLSTQKCLVKALERGDSEQTIAFLTDVLEEHVHQRLAIIWDGASYHRSQTVKAFLVRINAGLDQAQWRLTCLSFAPNDPTQNPIEDILVYV